MKSMFRPLVVLFAVLTAVTGLVYPAVMTAFGSVAFPSQAGGSLIEQNGRTVGSALIGQPFDAPRYFWGRLSATSPMPYNAQGSSASNLGPTNPALADQKQFTLPMGAEVFHNPRTGAPWSGDQVIWLAWNRAIEQSRVRYRRPYQTRHTYASMMLSAGEPPMWVANQMGHISLKMIEQRYGRWITDAAPDAGKRGEALFIG